MHFKFLMHVEHANNCNNLFTPKDDSYLVSSPSKISMFTDISLAKRVDHFVVFCNGF